jgi:DNA-3-methyladenine glycosylase II
MKDSLIQGISFLKKNDPILENIILRIGTCNLKPSETFYLNLLRSVISQQLSSKVVRTIWVRFEQLINNNFDPQIVLKTDSVALRNIGISYQKITYIREISQFFLTNPKIGEDLKKMSDEEVIQTLTKIKGIGIWTSQMFLIFTLGRLNVLPLDDVGLRRSIKKYYNFDSDIERQHLLKLSEKWGKYNTIACWYLWRALDNNG